MKTVVIELSIDMHCVTGVFQEDGGFSLIDPLKRFASYPIKKLEEQLNSMMICDTKGKPIEFKGRLVKTDLQKGGHYCLNFARLYIYSILKHQDPDAYQYVNDLFCTNQLKKFSNYKKIDTATKKLEIVSAQSENYNTFMLSWIQRTQGLPKDSWEDLTVGYFQGLEKRILLQEVQEGITTPEQSRYEINGKEYYKREICYGNHYGILLEKGKIPDMRQGGHPIALRKMVVPALKQGNKTTCLSSINGGTSLDSRCTLGSLIPTDSKIKRLILFTKGGNVIYKDVSLDSNYRD